jgi:mono/diheme cytochrome c family protein
MNLKAASALALAGVLVLTGCFGLGDDDDTPASVPVIVSQPSDKAIIIGQNATFTVTATGATRFQWVRNGNDTLAGQNTAVLTITSASLTDSGATYKCVVSNAKGSIATRSALLTVSSGLITLTRAQLLDTGSALYQSNCSGCHGPSGQGARGPTVANSDYVMGGDKRLIATLLIGVPNQITVNGVQYDGGGMPAWSAALTDAEIAGILTYLKGALNDSLVTNCVVNPSEPTQATCTKTARTAQAIATDSIAVSDVRAVRDSLGLANP